MDIMKIKTVADAQELLVVKPAKINKGAQMHEAIRALIDNPLSRAVYVVDDKDKLIGTISYRNLLRTSSARFGIRKDGIFSFTRYLKDLLRENVDSLMREPTPIDKETSLKHALKLMEEKKQDHLPVIDKTGHLIGELSGIEIMKLGIDVIKSGDEAGMRRE